MTQQCKKHYKTSDSLCLQRLHLPISPNCLTEFIKDAAIKYKIQTKYKILDKCSCLKKQVRKVLWTRKGMRATVVTAGHCTHAELTSGHALAIAVTAVACTLSRVYAN